MAKIVVIAAASGGVAALERLIIGMESPCTAAFFVTLHIGDLPDLLPEILVSGLPVTHAVDGEPIRAGRVYIAPPDRHLLIEPGCIRLSPGLRGERTRPAADPMFTSAAVAYGEAVVGIVLTGWGSDGAEGLRTIKEHGGIAIVQDPREAAAPEMPRLALQADHPECLSLSEIAARLRALCSAGEHTSATHTEAPERRPILGLGRMQSASTGD